MSIHSITNSTCITCILKGHIHWVMHASLNSNRHFTVLPAVQRWKQYKVTNFSPWGKMCVAFISPLVISQPVSSKSSQGVWWQDAKQGGLAVLPSSYQQSPESSLVPCLVLCIEAGHTTSCWFSFIYLMVQVLSYQSCQSTSTIFPSHELGSRITSVRLHLRISQVTQGAVKWAPIQAGYRGLRYPSV